MSQPEKPSRMRPLTSAERKQLRGLSHELHALVQVGKGGLSPGLRRQLEQALADHELVKVRFLEGPDKATKQALCEALTAATGAELAGLVGHVAILYRQQPDPEKRRVAMPDLYAVR